MDVADHRFALDERRWVELHTSSSPIVLLVPVGSCEQHGPHLPLATDTIIATAVATACCRHLEPSWRPFVTPPIAIGASGEHSGFPGTLSLGVEVTTAALIELARSADWAKCVVFVNGHGGNTAALRAGVDRCNRDGRVGVSAWSPSLDGVAEAHGDLHAGWIETSVMLHLRPELVDETGFEAGPETIDVDTLLNDGVAAVSPNGVLGNPSRASASRGQQLLETWVTDLVAHVNRFPTGHPSEGT